MADTEGCNYANREGTEALRYGRPVVGFRPSNGGAGGIGTRNDIEVACEGRTTPVRHSLWIRANGCQPEAW
jgi:hypothetical protein